MFCRCIVGYIRWYPSAFLGFYVTWVGVVSLSSLNACRLSDAGATGVAGVKGGMLLSILKSKLTIGGLSPPYF